MAFLSVCVYVSMCRYMWCDITCTFVCGHLCLYSLPEDMTQHDCALLRFYELSYLVAEFTFKINPKDSDYFRLQ